MTSAKISIAIGLGAAAIIAVLAYQVSTQTQNVKQLQEQVTEAEERAHTNLARQAEFDKVQEQNASYAKTIAGMEHDLAKTRAHLIDALAAKSEATAAVAGSKGNPLADMFKDPEILEAMRPEQIATTKMMYASLVKQLNLSPEQADKFYNILVDNGLKSLQSMQSGNSERIKSNTQSMEADLQSLLGDTGYAQYQSFTKNDLTDQTMLTAIKNDFVNNPLSDAQQQQLLEAMKSARQSVTANNLLDISPANSGDKMAVMGQAMQQQMQYQEQINQKVLQEAATFLSPEQLQTLSTSQSNMIATQKSMAPMMQKMLGNPSAGP